MEELALAALLRLYKGLEMRGGGLVGAANDISVKVYIGRGK